MSSSLNFGMYVKLKFKNWIDSFDCYTTLTIKHRYYIQNSLPCYQLLYFIDLTTFEKKFTNSDFCSEVK